jgi:hypothetical protein
MEPEARIALAQRRLRSVLRAHTVANARTLENKIADAGPTGQRIDPHILTPARQELEGREILRIGDRTTWFYLKGTDEGLLRHRLAEQEPILNEFQRQQFLRRVGQTLEIAVYKALLDTDVAVVGSFKDLDGHDDSRLYSKEEPPTGIGKRSTSAGQRLDYMIFDRANGAVGIEVKNVRDWLYPNSKEIREMLNKCCALDSVPVLIARRYPFVTFSLLNRCGVILHQTYNQLLPYTASDLAAKAKHKRLLGYHDIRIGSEPSLKASV